MKKQLRKVITALLVLALVLPNAIFASASDVAAAKWSKPNQTSGTVEYPRVVGADMIGTVAQFKDGDKVAFIGDSITYGGSYFKNIFNYYTTRYPNIKFSYFNKGVNSDDTQEAFDRLGRDVFNYNTKYTKIVIMLGANDMNRRLYFPDKQLESSFQASHNETMKRYEKRCRALIEAIKQRGVNDIILVTPPMFDEWVDESPNDNSPDMNNVMRKAGSLLFDLAKEYDIEFVDVNTPQLIVTQYNLEKNPYFCFVSDRIHADDLGHYIKTYAFLKAQGETGEVATVDIDLTQDKPTISASNANVSGVSVSGKNISYSYKANALPIGVDSVYRRVEEYIPITEDLNREIIRVKGLESGIYDIKMNNKVVTSVSADELEKGVNIADKENNPGQQQALQVLGIANQRHAEEYKDRYFVYTDEQKGILATGTYAGFNMQMKTTDDLLKAGKEWLRKNSKTASEEDIKKIQAWYDKKLGEKDRLDSFVEYEEMARKANKPKEINVVIAPSNKKASDGQVEAVVVDYELPANTVAIPTQNELNGTPYTQIVAEGAESGEFDYHISRYQTKVPYITSGGKEGVQITQASAIGGKAIVKAGDKTYTINIKHDPVPTLNAIVVAGAAVKDFKQNVLECNAPAPDEASIVVEAAPIDPALDVEITPSKGFGSAAKIKVTSPLGISRTYSVIPFKGDAESAITVYYNNKFLESDVPPTIVDGRTLIPMRALLEAMKATVSWDEATATATADDGKTKIVITENQKTVYVNDKAVELDVPAMIIDGRFVIPVRFVAENLGRKVEWIDIAQQVRITDIASQEALKVANAIAIKESTQSGAEANPQRQIAASHDGSYDTYWGVSSEGDVEAWGIYDLGKTYTLDKVYFSFLKGDQRKYKFAVDVSEDGTNYTPVIEKTETSGTYATGNLEGFDLGGVSARYVKYKGYGNNTNVWNSLAEIVISEKK
ncbi:MAG: hypothetical protein E7410_05120 [Ruminococcaceae bacterium]|nr:hypothetical protein [Oscillospiraceae bacterium]